MKHSSLLIAALGFLYGAEAILPIITSGNKFYQLNEDGSKPAESWSLIGVDYQPGGSSSFDVTGKSDVLSDGTACARDAYLLSQLGANVIRVYSISPWLNHDECMSVFNAAGIYVLLDVSNPTYALNRDNPASSYNSGLLNNIFGVVDAFKNYPNLLGFLSGNEVVNDGPSSQKVPKYVRAVQRDLKNYIKLHANRTIPVGYSAADDTTLRAAMFQYLQCGDDISKSDFYGLNTYEWCSGVNDYQNSGYADIKTEFENSSIPILFSEYGCNTKTPRTFDEVNGGLYGPLVDVVSGGLVYEYSNEANSYGLVDIASNGSVQIRQDYDNLKEAYSKIHLNTTYLESQTEATEVGPTCSNSSLPSGASQFGWDMNLPSCPDEDMLKNGGGNTNIGKIVDISHLSINATVEETDGNVDTPSPSYPTTNLIDAQTNVPTTASSANTASASSTSSSSASASKSSSSTSSSSSSSSSSKSKTGSKDVAAVVSASALTAIAALLFSFV